MAFHLQGKVPGCESVKKDVVTPGQIDGMSPRCYLVSDHQGLVNFPSVPPGQYILVRNDTVLIVINYQSPMCCFRYYSISSRFRTIAVKKLFSMLYQHRYH